MSVGRGREWNSFRNRKFDDAVARIEFIHWFAPTSGGKLDRKTAGLDEVERITHQPINLRFRPVAVYLDQVEMRKTIDQSARRDFADATKVICVNLIDISPNELRGARRHAVEHLIIAIQVMHRAKDEIEFVPILLYPITARRGGFWIVVEFNASTNLQIAVRFPQPCDLVEINSGT